MHLDFLFYLLFPKYNFLIASPADIGPIAILANQDFGDQPPPFLVLAIVSVTFDILSDSINIWLKIFLPLCRSQISFFFFLKILFIFRERERQRERKGEKHQCVVASLTPPTGDLACNPGKCPDWEWNRRPLCFVGQCPIQ